MLQETEPTRPRGVIILMLMQRDIAGRGKRRRVQERPRGWHRHGFHKENSRRLKHRIHATKDGWDSKEPEELVEHRPRRFGRRDAHLLSSHGQFFVRCSSVQERAKTIDVKTPIDVRPSLPTSPKKSDACPAGHRHSSSYSSVSLYHFGSWVVSGHSRNLA